MILEKQFIHLDREYHYGKLQIIAENLVMEQN